jgi:hypothetical protein
MKQKISQKQLPTVGSVYAVPLRNGQWGLCQIVGIEEKDRAVLGMAFGFMDKNQPKLSDIKKSKALVKTYPFWKSEHEILYDFFLDFTDNFVYLGSADLGKEVLEITQDSRRGYGYGSLLSFSLSIPNQWYWDHDRTQYEKFKQQIEQEKITEEQKEMEKEKKRQELLAKLTLDDLMKKDWFHFWKDDADPQLMDLSKSIIINTILQLKKIEKINKRNVSKIIKEAVLQFNELDNSNNNFIDTIKREDICDAFSEVGLVIKKQDVDEIVDEWREW